MFKSNNQAVKREQDELSCCAVAADPFSNVLTKGHNCDTLVFLYIYVTVGQQLSHSQPLSLLQNSHL